MSGFCRWRSFSGEPSGYRFDQVYLVAFHSAAALHQVPCINRTCLCQDLHKNFIIYSNVINIIANIPSTNPRIIKKHKTYYKVVMCLVVAKKFFSYLVNVSLLLIVPPLEKYVALLHQIHSQKFLLFLLCAL